MAAKKGAPLDAKSHLELVKENEGVNLLVLALDQGEGVRAKRSDTMMVATINPETNQASFISIPRDLYLKYPDGKFRRVDAAYRIGSAKLATEMVSNFFGIPIDSHLVVDYEGLKEIVDLMGGVQLTVKKRLQYTDEVSELEVDIKPGTQTLSGEEAIDYLRYRGNQSNFQRIDRQQKLLEALLQEVVTVENWSQLKSLIDKGYKFMKTNLSLKDMYNLGKTLWGLGMDDFDMATIPGKPARVHNKDVLLPRIVEARRIIARKISGLQRVRKADAKVYILNGEGTAFLARSTSDRLTKMGFSVTGTNNADRFNYKTSYLVTLNDKADELAELLNSELYFNLEIVREENFQDTMADLEEAGLSLPDGTNLLLIMGEGSPSFVSDGTRR